MFTSRDEAYRTLVLSALRGPRLGMRKAYGCLVVFQARTECRCGVLHGQIEKVHTGKRPNLRLSVPYHLVRLLPVSAVSGQVPLARGRPGHAPHLHQAQEPQPEREGGGSHLTDELEFYQLLEYTDDVDLQEKLGVWEEFYNVHRPHTSLNGQTPYEVLREKLLV